MIKVTGSLGTDGTVFAQTLDENGLGLHNLRQNYTYLSTNGRINWKEAQGGAFAALTEKFLPPGWWVSAAASALGDRGT